MAVFNLGLTVGLIPLGNQAGATVPAAFSANGGGDPLYPYPVGIGLTLIFAATLGYGATVAEPALNAMGVTVENLTDGAFPKKAPDPGGGGRALRSGLPSGSPRSFSSGRSCPCCWPDTRWRWRPRLWSSEEYVALAWDSAGVTTGP
jgi:hypothetical protein